MDTIPAGSKSPLKRRSYLSTNCAENVRLLEVLSQSLDSKLRPGLLVSDFDPIAHMAEIELIELSGVRTKVMSTEVVTSYSAWSESEIEIAAVSMIVDTTDFENSNSLPAMSSHAQWNAKLQCSRWPNLMTWSTTSDTNNWRSRCMLHLSNDWNHTSRSRYRRWWGSRLGKTAAWIRWHGKLRKTLKTESVEKGHS